MFFSSFIALRVFLVIRSRRTLKLSTASSNLFVVVHLVFQHVVEGIIRRASSVSSPSSLRFLVELVLARDEGEL